MSQSISISFGPAAGAFGRNGRFVPSSAELWRDELGRLVLDVFSARRGDTPPLVLKLETPDVAALLEGEAAASADGAPRSVQLSHPAPARGRNNWFNATELYFHAMPAVDTVEISAYSQRRGDQAPWSLYLSLADTRRLLSELDRLAQSS